MWILGFEDVFERVSKKPDKTNSDLLNVSLMMIK